MNVISTPPTVASITPSTTGPTNAASLTETVTFSKNVTGVDTSDFTVTSVKGTATATVASVTPVNGSVSTYLVSLTGETGDGTLRLDLNASNTGITDAAGNAVMGGFTQGDLTIFDHTAPTISGVTLDRTAYKVGDTVTATISLLANDGNGAYTLASGSTLDGVALMPGTYDTTKNTLTASFVVDANTPEVIQGSVPVNIVVDDAAGNASTPDTTGIGNETIDTHAPTAVSVAGFTNGATDTGNAPAAAGSAVGALMTTDASPGDSFTYALGGADAGRFTIASGVLDVGNAPLTDGTAYDLSVTSTDLGGNSYTQAVQVTGATTPTVTSIVPASASPTNSSSDPFTVTFSQAVSGVQASAFTLSGTDGTGTVGTPTTTDGGITYAVPVTGVSGNGTLGLDLTSTTGIVSTSTATTLAGTHSSDADYTIDTTAPNSPTVALSQDTGASQTDGITANPDLTVTPAETGGTLLYSTDGNTYSTTAPTFATDGSADGRHMVSVEQKDAAGNFSAPGSVTFTLDDTKPTVAITSPGGSTSTASQTVTGTVVDANPGATVSLYDNGSTTAFATAVLQANDTWTTTVTLAQGANSIVAQDTDLAGNTGASSPVVEMLGPVPAVTEALSNDTGMSASDGVTSVDTVTGTGDANAVVSFTVDGQAQTTTTTANASGGYTYTPAGLADGQHTIVASETNQFGTGSASTSFTLDTTAPAAPPTPADASVMNGSVNAANDTAGQTITGTAEAGSTVMVYDKGTLVDTTTANATTGAWSDQVGVLANGSTHSYTATATDTAGNVSAMSGALAFTVDMTRPTITAVAVSGMGIDANGNGDLDAGRVVTLTVSTSEPVYVVPAQGGGTPTLTLSDGATATYTGSTNGATSTLTFSYTVAAGQNAAKLAVSSVNANGATVTDAAGNPISTSLAGATVPSGTLEIDTTAPTVSSPTLTVAQNAPATPIGIAAPSDNLTAAGSLAIVAGTLPTDGTVTLNGTTPVTAGEALTAAQLTGLEFTPTAGAFDQGSTFTYTVTDGTGNATTGTAALNVGGAGAPTITGTHANNTTSEAPVTPFSGVTVADPSAATDMLTIALTGPGGTLSGAGLTANANGTYSLTGSAGTVTTELDALSFTPTAGAAGTTSTTTFVLTDTRSSGTSVTDAGTSVADTDPAAAPTPVQPAPTPTPVAPDAVSIDQAVTYSHGVFTLTGSASSAAGVRSVEISALVNGTREDLGPATVNANGTFTFSDAIGANQQGFLVATVTDNAGGQSTSADPLFSLTGGLGPRGGTGRQTTYSDGGNTEATMSLFRPNGTRSTHVEAPGQTVDLHPYDVVSNHRQAGTSFVYTPGAETSVVDVIHGFKVGGADHDTLSLSSSDFRNFTDVLRHTGDVNGSAFITDPKTGDAIRLAGVSTAELKQHPKDFSFHV